jgi:hypothetical protein
MAYLPEDVARQINEVHGQRVMLDDELGAKVDESLRIIFDAIRAMQTPPKTARKPLGFQPRT